MNEMLVIIIVMVVMGLSFGMLLAYANKRFAIEVNPLVHIVEDVLPKGQCGACGFAGCAAYAEAVVLKPDVAPNLCAPGKDAVAKQVAELTGKAAAPVEPRIAYLQCQGGHNIAAKKIEYNGVADCHAANLLFGGDKACRYGCLGFGTCTHSCVFDALTMGEDGLPKVDSDKCTGCGKCTEVCPKSVLTMVPLTAKVEVACCSFDKGVVVKKVCQKGCLACTVCMRDCPHGAIVMENNLPKVNHQKCMVCEEAKCTMRCPTKAILNFLS